jgi:hypothetical protein
VLKKTATLVFSFKGPATDNLDATFGFQTAENYCWQQIPSSFVVVGFSIEHIDSSK